MLKKFLDSQLSGLMPWIVFSLISGPKRLEVSVLFALAAAIVLFVLNLVEGDTFKALELSDIVFFSGLALVVAVVGNDAHKWLETWSSEIANIAFVLISVGSLVIRRPFTVPYAKDEADPSLWDDPDFIRANYVITAVWAVAFAVVAISGAYGDGVLHDPDNIWTNWIVQAVALIWAAQFTRWYAARARALARLAGGADSDPPPPVAELIKAVTGYTLVGTILGKGRQ